VALRPTAPRDRRSPNEFLSAIDADLIRRAAGGDQAAFDQLYDALFPIVWALSLQQVGSAAKDAQELTERLLERVVVSLDGYSRNLTFSTWLRKVLAEEIYAFTRRPLRASASPRRNRLPAQPRT
jgi:DNA-directed RNA polymerase specialized sigma24 family protein